MNFFGRFGAGAVVIIRFQYGFKWGIVWYNFFEYKKDGIDIMKDEDGVIDSDFIKDG